MTSSIDWATDSERLLNCRRTGEKYYLNIFSKSLTPRKKKKILGCVDVGLLYASSVIYKLNYAGIKPAQNYILL